jgi:hypothetical protein
MNIITNDNYLIYAAQNYRNPHCTSLNDFHKDCKRFITARTLLRIFHKGRKIKIQLLLNHIIVCSNMFNVEASVGLFFYHCEPQLYTYLVTIFDFLNILPVDVYDHIEPNEQIKKILEEI